MVKTFAYVVFVLGFLAGPGAAPAPASGIDFLSFTVGNADFRVPFSKDADLVSLYDVIDQRGFIGAETSFIDWCGFQATLGVATDGDVWDGNVNGNIFIGVRRHIGERFHIGLWIGRDFRDNLYRAGFKGSIELFGPNTL